MISNPCKTNSIDPFFWRGLFIFAITMVFVIGAYFAVDAISHANLRHGEEANMARSCAERPEHIFRNDSTLRTAFVCMIPDGRFGIVVVDEFGNEVTAFVKNKMKFFEQVKKYLENCHYKLLN